MTDWAQALKGNWRLVPKIATETQRWAKGAMNVWHKTTCPECGTDTSRGTSANARADLYEAMLAAAPKPPAGLYEVRADGSARRVEWETAIDQLAETIEAPTFMRNPDGSYVYPEIVRTAAREKVRAVIRFLTEGR